MNDIEFDRQFQQWLRDGPSSASPSVLRAVVEHVHTHRPSGGLRSSWHSLVGSVALPRPAPIVIQPVVLILSLAVAFALGAVVYAGWQQSRIIAPPPSPTPSVTPASPQPTTQRPAAYVCPPGTNPDLPGPQDQARPWAVSVQRVAVDTESGVMVAPAQTTEAHGTYLWLFDLCTNTWRLREVAVEWRVVSAVYAAAADLTVLIGAHGLFLYDADTDTLTPADRAVVPSGGDAVYDPMGNRILVRDAGRMWTYDIDRNNWQEVAQTGDIPPESGAQLMAYDSSVRRIILYYEDDIVVGGPLSEAFAGARTYEFDPRTSAWAQVQTDTPEMVFVFGDLVSGGEIVYDEMHKRTIVFSRGRAIAYDATTSKWEVVFDSLMEAGPLLWNDPTHRQAASLAYDPVHRRTLAIGGTRRVETWPYYWIDADDVIAFDLDTRTWSELLAPTVEIPPWRSPPPEPAS